MAIKTPTINGIIRMTEFDLLRTKIKQGYMYMCLDSLNLYYDETDSRRVRYTYVSIKTANDLFYNITPSSGTTYYCWEDNSLWLWMNKWISLWTDSTYPAAYNYDSANPTSANPSSLNYVYYNDDPNTPVDTNGLLKDGSVIVRDRNRIIKGKIYIEDNNDNLTISSFLGGGIRFLPNGKMDTDGELLIGDDGKSIFRTELHLLNNEAYIDYSEDPDSDPSDYPNDKHIYEIFHSGNLDVSAIKVLNPLDIYNKLLDDSLPDPLEFSVKYLNGKTSDEFALSQHNHIATDITDFNDKARAQAEVKIKEIFNNMIGEGIYISYISSSSTFKMSANNFNITFDGGVSGTATVTHLGDTTAELTVNPARHVHQNYIDTMNSLQDQLDHISTVDPTDYYNKLQTDEKLALITGTPSPEAGKPLLVNSDLKLPGTALNADRLSSEVLLKFIGDLTAEVSTDLSSTVEINLNTSNILSDTAEIGKAVKVNSEGDLPVNSTSASRLNHDILINLQGEVEGQATLDTSLNTINIDTILVPGDNILQSKDLGVKIATLGDDGRIPKSQLPVSQAGLVPQGYWNPETGAPSTEPTEGQFWIVSNEGVFENKLYKINDWCLYYNSAWNNINTNDNVISVNSKTGIVELTNDDVNAISKDYINYTVGDIIPQNKIVLASQDGVIEGATVSKLTNSFNILTDTYGDIRISDDSVNTQTDGSKDISLKLEITPTGYENILNTVGYTLYDGNAKLPYKPNLSFGEGLSVVSSENMITINSGISNINTLFLDINTEDPEVIDKFKAEFIKAYDERYNKPLIIFANTLDNDDEYSIFKIDKSCPAYEEGTTKELILYSYVPNMANRQNYDKNNSLVTMNDSYYKLTIGLTMLDGEVNITYSLTLQQTKYPTFIQTNEALEGEVINAFIPKYDYQPVSKKYVDDEINSREYITVIGDGQNNVFTITHNLGSENVVVNFRNMNDNNQVCLANKVVDENTIEVTADNILTEDEIKVIIKK